MKGDPEVKRMELVKMAGAMPVARALAGAFLSLLLVVGHFAAVPAHAATLFGVVDTGEIFASTDQGVTWIARAVLPVSDAAAFGAELISNELRLATRSGDFWVSSDAGVNWSAIGTVAASDITGLAIRPDGEVLLLTEAGSLYESVDGGLNFAAIAALGAVNFVDLLATSATRCYALTRSGEVFGSTDAGLSWSVGGSMPVSDAVALGSTGSMIYVLTGTGDIHASTDDGVTWAAIGTLSQVGMATLLESEGELVAITREGHAATSADGTAWTWRGSINQVEIVSAGTDAPATGVDQPLSHSIRLALAAPRPNPRVGSGTGIFMVTTPQAEWIKLSLINVQGRVVAHRPAEELPAAGVHGVIWNPGDLETGVYFVRLETATGKSASAKWTALR